MDADKANLWMGGSRTTVPVYDYADGVSVGGVYQLVGNVWEWTTTEFGEWHSEDCRVDSPNELKSLRGGAFDTYFDSHAVCQFQSGDSPLARKHNIGFRCALGECDVTSEALEKQK
jgi:iron(II)-dependent oxidoreductase